MYLFLAACFWPVLEQSAADRLGERGVLLEELHHAVGQLRVVQREALDLVQRQQNLYQELLVLSLQRQRKTVDDAETLTS